MDVLTALAGAAACLLLWGALSPRTFWSALIAPLRSDPRETEPSRPAFAAGRLLALVGLLSLAVAVVGFLP